jgi:hypothetical protein
MSNAASRKRAATLRQSQIRAKAPALRGLDESRPSFVADVMLGRLAKWLRVARARREGRILLSRDTRLLVRKAVKQFIFLESDKVQDQIRQIFEHTRTTDLPRLLTRCLSCNELLNEVPRETVREIVPPYVYQTQAHFKSCPQCRKVYWAGTHRQSVVRTLEALTRKS